VALIVNCLILAIAPLSNEFFSLIMKKGWLFAILVEMCVATLNSLFVFNITAAITRKQAIKRMPFLKRNLIILATIILTVTIVNLPLNYIGNNYSFKNVMFSVVFSFYMGSAVGFVYIAMSYIDADRKRKLNEKELEVARLSALKTKAELDALHSKVNPHFLYNALNSIADLSITDGRKARRMTIALADLFRYSINYSQNNYSTVNDEVAMTEVYLQIEKIRFEDQLNYKVSVDEAAGHYLVPRFVLQPLAENAVKHGLKATGRMTELYLEVKKTEDGMIIIMSDNGPAFPDELVPGYGVKSVFDKLDLLFPGEYEIHFTNEPRKQVSIHLHKLMKNEPGV
jgi:two-component system, LytTR family, sensor kinase